MDRAIASGVTPAVAGIPIRQRGALCLRKKARPRPVKGPGKRWHLSGEVGRSSRKTPQKNIQKHNGKQR
jgi:hypothetical protein